jgi:hypothetical protein
MENSPFVGDGHRHDVAALGEKQQAGGADRRWTEAREQERGAGANRGDDDAAKC